MDRPNPVDAPVMSKVFIQMVTLRPSSQEFKCQKEQSTALFRPVPMTLTIVDNCPLDHSLKSVSTHGLPDYRTAR